MSASFVKSALRLLAAGAAVAAATFVGAGSSYAQGPCPQCGPQVQIKDVDKAIGEAAQSMGLVRAILQTIGQMNNYEYVANGSWVDLEAATLGQPQPVSKIVWNVHQQLWASRMQVSGVAAHRVVKGNRAWDETWFEEKGKAGTVKKIRTNPADGAAKLRAQLVWLEPHAFLSHVAFAANKKCLLTEAKACETKWSKGEENGLTTLSVEINGVTYKGTLDAKKRIGSIEAKLDLPSGAGKTVVAKYTQWRAGETDTNDPKDRAAQGPKALDKFHNGLYWPEKVVWELDGQKVLDLTVTEGWGNPYTIYPEPELLAKAQ